MCRQENTEIYNIVLFSTANVIQNTHIIITTVIDIDVRSRSLVDGSNLVYE